MKKLLVVLLGLLITSSAATGTDVYGWWKGEVMNLPVVFHIVAQDGTDVATLSSPAQGVRDLPCDKVIINGDSVFITMAQIGMTFSGVLGDDRENIAGKFSQGGISLPMNLERTTENAAMIYRPQTPKPPFPYRSENVTFANGNITLAGTLTIPYGKFRRGAIVLVSGSGAQNRDEEIFGHRPFAVLADALSRAGWAVLRYDDRGVGESSPGTPDDTTLDFATDALAAIDYLKTRPDINPERIGILGHSEGGTIAIINAATRPEDVAFIITMATPAVKGRDLIIKQNEMIAEVVSGTPLDKTTMESVTNVFDALNTINDTTTLRQRLTDILDARPGMTPDERDRQIAAMTSPWYLAMVRLDPAPYMKQIRCPMLALNGTWDVQVDATQNLEAIAAAVPQAVITPMPSLNHLFQSSASRRESFNYANISETLSPALIEAVLAFLKPL